MGCHYARAHVHTPLLYLVFRVVNNTESTGYTVRKISTAVSPVSASKNWRNCGAYLTNCISCTLCVVFDAEDDLIVETRTSLLHSTGLIFCLNFDT